MKTSDKLFVPCVTPTGFPSTNRILAAALVVSVLVACQNASALNLVLNFGPNTGSSIQFNGNLQSFNFNVGNNGYQWNVSSETGGSSAMGLNGSVLGGPFSYGPITINGLTQSAAVLGPLGNLVINDGSLNLSGTVNWIDIETFYTVGGFLNAAVNVNLSGVTYSGSNPDLQTIQAEQPGILDVSFQFSPGQTLTQLSTGTGTSITSYSGSVSVVPEPTTLALAGLGGLSLLLLRRPRK